MREDEPKLRRVIEDFLEYTIELQSKVWVGFEKAQW